MDTNFIAIAKSKYDELLHMEEASNVEFWYARDLMSLEELSFLAKAVK